MTTEMDSPDSSSLRDDCTQTFSHDRSFRHRYFYEHVMSAAASDFLILLRAFFSHSLQIDPLTPILIINSSRLPLFLAGELPEADIIPKAD